MQHLLGNAVIIKPYVVTHPTKSISVNVYFEVDRIHFLQDFCAGIMGVKIPGGCHILLKRILAALITCGGVRLVSASTVPKLILETSIQFYINQAYMTDKLCIFGWVDWICMHYNYPVYQNVPPDDMQTVLQTALVLLVGR